ncbi:uncharacterized protein UV8b_01103 [Ustilaginoidea virens]|uniref:Rhodopsin domain-containing protein n=1 Tax=Ustilaginoidea virens TaxID=1159556 RepID=A0A063C913_USTVR|nr:uncharacterized protein UV8b_01103 [Ustilaginoidea virens]QUC16862.1 hypothetical protein UV8b_01103 [Ustilaginoidea virens]GAO16832.1 hypothetical protein UVI_02053710 [Ustilaginoidea virens]
MSVYSDPPELRPFRLDKPTLLVCWWATSFCTLMILLRVSGRFVRTERLFVEDKIAALAVIPLNLRMVCVHYVLSYGTNNADFAAAELSSEQLRQKAIASGLVLLSRFFYAATLWTLKFCILEFLKRITDLTWERSHHVALVAIRWALVLTFVGVIVSDLTECHPFSHYWQVLPDPGGSCRQAYVQLITMACCNILTDLLLVVFPIPLILKSNMAASRKLQLVLLFSLSLGVVAITVFRLPRIIHEHGRQQYRSLLASVELLFATAAANALVLGSFVRDRGVKKQKFRRNSGAADSFDRTSTNPRRPALHRHWGSDEDLFRDVGLGVDPELREQLDRADVERIGPAPRVMMAQYLAPDVDWQGANRRSQTERSDDSLFPDDALLKPALHGRRRAMSFLDVGGLLDDSVKGSSSGSCRRGSYTSSAPDPPTSPGTAPPPPPPAPASASKSGIHRGSTALLQDLGGLLGPLNARTSKARSSDVDTELQTIPQSREVQAVTCHSKPSLELMDPAGLLK